MPQTPIQPGFIVLHSNLSESLAQTVVSWLKTNPLDPLEEEIFLVQSNGMAEWLKMELASMGGVYAATRVELPAKFLWQTYRQVLGRDAVPTDSPLDKIPMTWRIMQLLPTLLDDPDFAPIKGFLKEDEPDRQLQLASRLADQFDQYQIYRADWLESWARGEDVLILGNETKRDLPSDQNWQPKLWRALLSTLSESQQAVIRPRLHTKVLHKLNQVDSLNSKVVRRVVVFCVSQFPWSSLVELAALSQHSQVIFAVFNPCRFYWGDIIEGRELLRAVRRRQANRDRLDLSNVALEHMHHQANPLLASWGRQSRDFVRMLDEFDDAEQTRKQFSSLKIDLFEESVDPDDSMLQRIQNQIRDLEPLPSEFKSQVISSSDRSVVFHIAHSKVRELEILHDQLLQYLAESSSGNQLQPRDIVVMVPDIEQMAPAIRAVFGQYKRSDPRFIPYDISDLGAKADSPLISAIEWLLRLPQQRTRLSELIDLLEVPAIASRFGIEQDQLPKLVGWLQGAGVRWGLNEEQRRDMDLEACGNQNTAIFGLQRMLLGYCNGSVNDGTTTSSFNNIEPYPEIGGLEAELAGSFGHFLHGLTQWWELSRSDAIPDVWVERARQMLDDLVRPQDEIEKQAAGLLRSALGVWLQACEGASFVEPVSLTIFRSAWMDALDRPTLSRRFRAGGVTFCSLMPMRVIPFKIVCLLGMNEGDYPRISIRSDFDLMGLKGMSRPGDRSRKEDDRQLLLEALLSARQTLYISWSGKSIRDNSDQPPSVLVTQLREYIKGCWGEASVESRTTEHPLQPFSRRYFENNSGLMTYASEWRVAHSESSAHAVIGDSNNSEDNVSPFDLRDRPALTMQQLITFLRNPVKAFFRHRLSVTFDEEENDDFDDEPFEVSGLERYGFIHDLLSTRAAELKQTEVDRYVQARLDQIKRAGLLPVKGFGELALSDLNEVLKQMLHAYIEQEQHYGLPTLRQPLRVEFDGVVLEDWLDHLRELGEKSVNTTSADHDAEKCDVVSLKIEPGRFYKKSNKSLVINPSKLVGAWITSLVAAACDIKVRLVFVSQDSVVTVSPVEKDAALTSLKDVVSLWKSGMNQPLPLPLKTSIVFADLKLKASRKKSKSNAQANKSSNDEGLNSNGLPKDVVNEYEGSPGFNGFEPKKGECEEMCLSRQYRDIEALCAAGFEKLAWDTYLPLLNWIETHVSNQLHQASVDSIQAEIDTVTVGDDA